MRSKELRRDGEARNLSREERKMLAIVRQIEEMEHKEKAVKAVSEAGAWQTQLEGRVGHGNEKVGKKRRFREACDTGGGEAAKQHKQQGKGGGKQCGGSGICEHNRRRSGCKQCGGSSICEHNRERSKCKQCSGASTAMQRGKHLNRGASSL